MKHSFIALITPLKKPTEPGVPPTTGGEHPDHTLPGDLPHPEHPIYYPLPPDAPVDPEYGIPEDGPHPDHTLPGDLPHPEHPIVLPPNSGGWLPIFIWNQPHPDHTLPTDPHPEHPIVLPPDQPAPPEAGGGVIKWKAAWTPENGWQTIGVIVPDGSKPIPTPSKRR